MTTAGPGGRDRAWALLLVGWRVRAALLALGAVLVLVTFGHLVAEPLYPFHQHVIPRAGLVFLLLWLPRSEDRFALDRRLERGGHANRTMEGS